MYMARHRDKGITQLEATEMLGILRLSQRIIELQNSGFRIRKRTVKVPNRFKDNCYVKRYWLDA